MVLSCVVLSASQHLHFNDVLHNFPDECLLRLARHKVELFLADLSVCMCSLVLVRLASGVFAFEVW